MTGELGARLAKHLEDLMTRKEMSQAALAIAADISQAYVSQILNCEREPSLSILEQLGSALEVDPVELLTSDVTHERQHNGSLQTQIGGSHASAAVSMLDQITIGRLRDAFLGIAAAYTKAAGRVIGEQAPNTDVAQPEHGTRGGSPDRPSAA